MRCDLIIPALNERANIKALFDVLDVLRGQCGEDVKVRHVIVADNGSTDGTREASAARGAVVVEEAARGYGAACQKAVGWIGKQKEPPDIVAFLDADLSDDPRVLTLLVDPIVRGKAELVLGSRVKRAKAGALSGRDRFRTAVARGLLRVLGGRRHTDLGPFRAVTWAALRRLGMCERGGGWAAEMLMRAALLDIATTEVDVPYHPRRAGRSKLCGGPGGMLIGGWVMVRTIVGLWLRRRRIIEADVAARSGGASWDCGA